MNNEKVYVELKKSNSRRRKTEHQRYKNTVVEFLVSV